MPYLIETGAAANDAWKTVRLAADEAPHAIRLPAGPLLVPVAVWKARRADLVRREYEHGWPLGVWLAAGENPSSIVADLDDFTVVALEFDSLDDGNAYFTARLLRERYGYRGELRVIGDVPEHKRPYLRQIGFDVIATGNGQRLDTLATESERDRARPRLVAA